MRTIFSLQRIESITILVAFVKVTEIGGVQRFAQHSASKQVSIGSRRRFLRTEALQKIPRSRHAAAWQVGYILSVLFGERPKCASGIFHHRFPFMSNAS
jgi:hypothetical protein